MLHLTTFADAHKGGVRFSALKNNVTFRDERTFRHADSSALLQSTATGHGYVKHFCHFAEQRQFLSERERGEESQLKLSHTDSHVGQGIQQACRREWGARTNFSKFYSHEAWCRKTWNLSPSGKLPANNKQNNGSNRINTDVQCHL